MITRKEFALRVSRLWELTFRPQDEYAYRMQQAGKPVTKEGDDELKLAMMQADAYQVEFLSEDVLAHFLDPISPPGTYDNRSRSEALLENGVAAWYGSAKKA